MAKFDWSRVNLRFLDPARFNPTRDFFLAPDKPATPNQNNPKKKSKPATKQKQIRHEARMAEQRAGLLKSKAAKRSAQLERQRLENTAKATKQAEAKKQKAEAKQRKEAKALARKAAAEARRAAFAEYQKTPEYAAEVEYERARMAAKKKSHLQAWVERQTGLTVDREALRQRWREGLLTKRPTDVND